MMKGSRKTLRVIAPGKVKDLKRALNGLAEVKPAELSKSEVIRELRSEIETARSKGYSNKDLAQLFTDRTGSTFTAQDISAALKLNSAPLEADTTTTTEVSTAE